MTRPKLKPKPFKTMSDVRRANRAIGHHWFDPDTKRFFKSRIESALLSGRWFITSEQGPDGCRRYTVREATPNGSVETVERFSLFSTLAEAREAVRLLKKQTKNRKETP